MKIKSITALLVVLSSLAVSSQPTILVEAEDLLKAIAVDTRSQGVNLYDWKLTGGSVSPIAWSEEGNRWTQEGFERRGEVPLSNNGKITHNVVGDTVEKGKWKLLFLGSKDRITKVTITPNATTQENPRIEIQKQYIQEKHICSSDGNTTKEALLLKYPSKHVLWTEVVATSSPKGNSSVYTITFDRKPECLIATEYKKQYSAEDKNESNNEHQQYFPAKQISENSPSSDQAYVGYHTQDAKNIENMPNLKNFTNSNNMQIYYARISQKDHRGKRGQKLKDVGIILQQDRANYHKYHKRDREDTGDNRFDTRGNRDKIKRMLARGSTSKKTLAAIRYGTPLVKVKIYNDSIDVTLKSGAPKTQRSKGKPSKCNTVGYIRGISRQGDGFVAVRKGPGTEHRMISKIYRNGTKVRICDRKGKWKGIVYGDCIEGSSRSRNGSCGRGWVYGKYVR